MRRPWSCAVMALVVGAATGPKAGAAEPSFPGPQPLRLQYDAPPSCPDALSFFLQVQARTERVRLALPGEPGRIVSVSIQDTEAGSRGALGLPSESNETFVREVRAETCGEIALALSLVLALAFDPDAKVSIPAAPPVPTPPPAEPSVVPPAVPPAPAPPPPPPAPAPEREVPFRIAVGAMALGTTGPAPGLSPVLGPFLEVHARDDSTILAPRVRGTFWYGPEQVAEVSGRSATLSVLAGRLEGCPVVLSPADIVRLAPCVAVDVGQVSAAGSAGVSPRESQNRPWVAGWLLGSMRIEPLSPLFLELQAAVGVPFVRDDFVLAGPDETVHAVPSVLVQGGIGAGVAFP